MNILSVEDISKQYSDRPLFTHVSFGLDKGDRIGVIGVNGSGKTTLLRVLAGVEPPDTGRVVIANGVRVAYLSQNPLLDDQQTVLDAIFASPAPMIQLLRRYEQTSAALAHHPADSQLLAELDALTAQMDALNAWEAEAAAQTILSQMGLAEHVASPVGLLSGGQRKRVTMAQALVDQPDLLILDEPTNHIDTETIAWLESYLTRFSGSLILVTHDRYFLDRVVTRMVELDRGQVTVYVGNYASFLEQKTEREARAATEEEARQNMLRRELAWLRRGAQARTTKQKAHVQRVYDLMDQRPDNRAGSVSIDIASRRVGKRVLELHNVAKQFGDQVLIKDFSFDLRRDDRLGIIGPNGSGKTTLLNMIADRLMPDTGQINVGETIHLAYYDQESAGLDETQRVIDYIREAAELVKGASGAMVTATQMLERFLFPPDAQWALIGALSGGERRRLYLLRTLLIAPNLLLLDEPTNDLDIQTLTVLEDYLETFNGAVIVVSHDRYFLDRTVQHILAFESGGQIREYPGGYSDYALYRAQQQAQQSAPSKPRASGSGKTDATTPQRPRRLTFKEKRELADLEQRIADLEEQKTTLSHQLNSVGDDYQSYQRLAEDLAQLDASLETAFERWAELAKLAEQ
ncbi:MAG: ABC-F family ATP-binding cassette domain-containing protein [Chloroflexales bacterium]|nr:ABC-F family ATP-binding cassette domain-containing protein [Chloroflexales bacterium]